MKKLVQNKLHWKDIQDEVYSQEDVLNLYDDYIAAIDAHNEMVQYIWRMNEAKAIRDKRLQA